MSSNDCFEAPADFSDSTHQQEYSGKLDSAILQAKVKAIKSPDHCRNKEAKFVRHAPHASLCLHRASDF